MGFLNPISKIDKRLKGLTITADKQERLCLSAELRKELNQEKDTLLYLFFDEEDNRIGISKKGSTPEHAPYKFDARGYATANDFMGRCGIDTSKQAIRYIYEGVERGVMIFRQEGVKNRAFIQEQNGNLERLGS